MKETHTPEQTGSITGRSMLNNRKQLLAQMLMKDGAFLTRDSRHPLVVTRGKERGFKLALHDREPDAPLSPYYLNIRVSTNPSKVGTVRNKTVRLAAQCMHLQAMNWGYSYDYVAGVPNAGDPFAHAYGEIADVPVLQLVKSEKGGKRIIERLIGDPPEKEKRVLMVDDLITSADSKFLGIDALKSQYQLVVPGVSVIVDREQGGRNKLAERGVKLSSLFTITELLNQYLTLGSISPMLYKDIEKYMGRN